MRSLLAFGLVALTACADLREPTIDGAVSAVSKADISAITVAVDHFLADRHHVNLPIFRMHVVNHNQVQVYRGEHYGSSAQVGNQSYIEVNRIGGRWQATEEVLRY